ncbi:putative Golgi integral membrane protein [Saccharata proteae CBS 121410]|uniref:Protein BTN n=1 Tax=Saccharata proteae CBS 121410 TaxID=1314787 RepID=A0A9P4LY30_9PEZI|nr:putative Golgi integral membrane protein [Saccharata proteae CBS 121410]
MLPMPFTPAASWPLYKAKLQSVFAGADPRVCAAFWLFGLINNVLYVIILSSALDLVGPAVPKGVVLLADVIPSFCTKLIAPYFIDGVPYSLRVLVLVALSSSGMLLIALTPPEINSTTVATRMVGIIFASLSAGGGELSFLGLTHYYGHFSLAAWGSGTGGAGLVGAGAYVVATTSLGLSVRTSLLAFSFLPVIMLVSFFFVLPRGPLNKKAKKRTEYEQIEGEEDSDDDALGVQDRDDEGLLASSTLSASSRFSSSAIHKQGQDHGIWVRVKSHLKRSAGLFVPYMLPLLLVYISEYTINQGVAPTLLFPLSSSPFTSYRDFYPTYNAIYQVGVFLSRSSTPFFRIHALYTPSILQVLNLVILTLHAMFDFLPNVYVVCAVIFWEGLLGGLVYVSTFAEIMENVPREEREFSLSITSVSDSAGVCAAGFLGMVFEVRLCDWQVRHGRDYCRLL